MQQINNFFSQEVNHNHYYKMPEKFRLPFQLFLHFGAPKLRKQDKLISNHD